MVKNTILIVCLVISASNLRSQDVRLIMKDKSQKTVTVNGSSVGSLLTNVGNVSFNEIDTLIVLNDKKPVLKELAFRSVPVKLNGKMYYAKDLFIDDLPFAKSGELIFEGQVILKKPIIQWDEISKGLKISNRETRLYDFDKGRNMMNLHIREPMSTSTRIGWDSFYDQSYINYNVTISLSGDTLKTRVFGIEYEVIDTYGVSYSVKSSKKYFPDDLFKKSNYYDGRRVKQLNKNYRDETMRLITALLIAVDENCQ